MSSKKQFSSHFSHVTHSTNFFARVGGHRITSSENQWEAFRNTKHYRTSDSCFVAFFFSLSLLHNMRHFILGFRRFKTFLFSFSFHFFFFNRRTVAGATEKVAGDIAGRRRFLTTLVSYVMLAFSALHFPSIWLVTLKKSWNLIGNIFLGLLSHWLG